MKHYCSLTFPVRTSSKGALRLAHRKAQTSGGEQFVAIDVIRRSWAGSRRAGSSHLKEEIDERVSAARRCMPPCAEKKFIAAEKLSP